MKNTPIVLLVVTVALCVAAPAAQSQEDYVELLRTDLNAQMTAIMTEAMQLTSEQGEAFWPLWREYRNEVAKLGDREIALLKDYAEHYEQMDDEKASKLAEEALDIDRKQLDLRKKYWKKVRGELGGVIAARFMQVDNQLSNLVAVQISSQIPLVEAPASGSGY
jgi:hypothetical protein